MKKQRQPAEALPQASEANAPEPRLPIVRWGLYLVVILIVALIGWADAQSLHRYLFDLDDPYITLHNAQVLLSGRDPNYGAVPPLVGATSAIHLLLVTVLLCLSGPEVALHLANWLGIALYLGGIVRL